MCGRHREDWSPYVHVVLVCPSFSRILWFVCLCYIWIRSVLSLLVSFILFLVARSSAEYPQDSDVRGSCEVCRWWIFLYYFFQFPTWPAEFRVQELLRTGAHPSCAPIKSLYRGPDGGVRSSKTPLDTSSSELSSHQMAIRSHPGIQDLSASLISSELCSHQMISAAIQEFKNSPPVRFRPS